jgi:mannose-6-phosphate isomerase-like protein (cupin superfamily)
LISRWDRRAIWIFLLRASQPLKQQQRTSTLLHEREDDVWSRYRARYVNALSRCLMRTKSASRPAHLSCLLLLAFAMPIEGAEEPRGVALPGDTILLVALPGAPAGVVSAVLVGDLSKPGIYVLRNKWPPNTTLAPHTHGDKWRVYTVLEGEIRMGFGLKIDEAKMVRLGPGSVFTGPVDLPHYFITGENGATLHVVAEGPFVTTFVRP